MQRNVIVLSESSRLRPDHNRHTTKRIIVVAIDIIVSLVKIEQVHGLAVERWNQFDISINILDIELVAGCHSEEVND